MASQKNMSDDQQRHVRNVYGNMMSTELFEAIDQHDVEKVITRLKQNVSIEDARKTRPHWRPLEAAIEELKTGGSIDIVRRLVNAGADVNSRDPQGSLTPLHCAVFGDSFEATQLLLEHGADPTCISDEGDTPLKHVAENRQLETARLLLQHGAEKNINYCGGACGLAALHLAVKNLDKTMIRLLVDAGADPELHDADGLPVRTYLPPKESSDLTTWKSAASALDEYRKLK